MKNSKTPLFLIEVVIMLLVFAFSAAVCLKVFVGAKTISEESFALDCAITESQKTAEVWQANHADLEKTANELNAEIIGKSFVLYYNENFDQTDKNNSVYELKLSSSGSKADISVYKGSEDIYSIFCEAVMYGG